MRADASGNSRLIAYIVPEGERRLAVESLRRFLQDKMPDYMLPQVFVTLSNLPRTHSGKIDRKALPDADRERPEMETPYVPPVNEQEEVLCNIWGQVLELDRVGTRDGFFDLGGTSVQGVHLVEKIRQALQVDLHVATLFQYPSVALLSAHIKSEGQSLKSFAGLEERAKRHRSAVSSRKR